MADELIQTSEWPVTDTHKGCGARWRGGRAEELRAEKGQTPLKKTGGHRSVLR